MRFQAQLIYLTWLIKNKEKKKYLLWFVDEMCYLIKIIQYYYLIMYTYLVIILLCVYQL